MKSIHVSRKIAVSVSVIFGAYVVFLGFKAISMFNGAENTRSHVQNLISGDGIGECSSESEPVSQQEFNACFRNAKILDVFTENASDPISDQYRVVLECTNEHPTIYIEIVMVRGGGKPWCAYSLNDKLLKSTTPVLLSVAPPEYPYIQKILFIFFALFLNE